MKTLRKLLRALLFALIAAFLLFEEWGWEPLAAAFARLARLPLWAALERKIAGLSPRASMLVFAVPMLALLPLKLLALYLFAQGHATLGVILLLGAKLAGTALLARLFQLTQPALMQLRWFAWGYPRWKAWKDGVLAQVRGSPLWRAGHALRQSVKAWWADLHW
jgi:hypothetical protein